MSRFDHADGNTEQQDYASQNARNQSGFDWPQQGQGRGNSYNRRGMGRQTGGRFSEGETQGSWVDRGAKHGRTDERAQMGQRGGFGGGRKPQFEEGRIEVDERMFPPGSQPASVLIGSKGSNQRRMVSAAHLDGFPDVIVGVRGRGITTAGHPGSEDDIHVHVKYYTEEQFERVKEIYAEIVRQVSDTPADVLWRIHTLGHEHANSIKVRDLPDFHLKKFRYDLDWDKFFDAPVEEVLPKLPNLFTLGEDPATQCATVRPKLGQAQPEEDFRHLCHNLPNIRAQGRPPPHDGRDRNPRQHRQTQHSESRPSAGASENRAYDGTMEGGDRGRGGFGARRPHRGPGDRPMGRGATAAQQLWFDGGRGAGGPYPHGQPFDRMGGDDVGEANHQYPPSFNSEMGVQSQPRGDERMGFRPEGSYPVPGGASNTRRDWNIHGQMASMHGGQHASFGNGEISQQSVGAGFDQGIAADATKLLGRTDLPDPETCPLLLLLQGMHHFIDYAHNGGLALDEFEREFGKHFDVEFWSPHPRLKTAAEICRAFKDKIFDIVEDGVMAPVVKAHTPPNFKAVSETLMGETSMQAQTMIQAVLPPRRPPLHQNLPPQHVGGHLALQHHQQAPGTAGAQHIQQRHTQGQPPHMQTMLVPLQGGHHIQSQSSHQAQQIGAQHMASQQGVHHVSTQGQAPPMQGPTTGQHMPHQAPPQQHSQAQPLASHLMPPQPLLPRSHHPIPGHDSATPDHTDGSHGVPFARPYPSQHQSQYPYPPVGTPHRPPLGGAPIRPSPHIPPNPYAAEGGLNQPPPQQGSSDNGTPSPTTIFPTGKLLGVKAALIGKRE
eukprot:GHVN01019648.1.p1 GENE.GHVN01019648.1~~GHVN01019648.1.p1  ORF type:complete len:831 (-),score=101.01 GHVN01019648.1:641-3133(-)